MFTKAMSTAQVLVLARFALMLIEMALIRAHLVRGRYTVKDTLASVSMRAGNYATNILLAGVTVATFAYFYQFRLFDISMSGGEASDREFSTPLMWARVGLQAFAVVLLLIALYLR